MYFDIGVLRKTTYMCKLFGIGPRHVGSGAEAADPYAAFFYKYISKNAYFRHRSIYNDKIRHQCNRVRKNKNPTSGAA